MQTVLFCIALFASNFKASALCDFACANGNCVDSSLTCDGNPDCNDGSDEFGCDSQCTFDTNFCGWDDPVGVPHLPWTRRNDPNADSASPEADASGNPQGYYVGCGPLSMAVVDGKMKSRLLHRDTHIGLTFSYYVYGDDATRVPVVRLVVSGESSPLFETGDDLTRQWNESGVIGLPASASSSFHFTFVITDYDKTFGFLYPIDGVLAVDSVTILCVTLGELNITASSLNPYVGDSVNFAVVTNVSREVYFRWGFDDETSLYYAQLATTNHAYTQPGNYSVTVEASFCGQYKSQSVLVTVNAYEPINLHFPRYVSVNRSFVIECRFESGILISESDIYVGNDFYFSSDGRATVEVDQPGSYVVSCSADWVSPISEMIYAQEGVNGVYASILNHVIGFNTNVTASFTGFVSTGTNMTARWEFGDGTTVTRDCTPKERFSIEHSYAMGGLYEVSLEVSNNVSYVKVVVGNVTVVENVDSVSLDGSTMILLFRYINLSAVVSGGEGGEALTTYAWSLIDSTGVAIATRIGDESRFLFLLNSTGLFNVSVNVSNSFSWSFASLSVAVIRIESTSSSPSSPSSPSSLPPSESSLLSLVSSSSSSALQVNMSISHDPTVIVGSSTTIRLIADVRLIDYDFSIDFGDASQSLVGRGTQANESSVASLFVLLLAQHVYTVEGSYVIRASVEANEMSSNASSQIVVVVSACNTPPVVTITSQADYDETQSSYRAYRSEAIAFRSSVIFSCGRRARARYEWKIIDLTSMLAFGLEEILADLPSMFLQANFLPYGNYRVRLRVTSDGFDFEGSDAIALDVVASTLIARINGGTWRVVSDSSRRDVVLDAAAASYDPDGDGDDDERTFAWSCLGRLTTIDAIDCEEINGTECSLSLHGNGTDGRLRLRRGTLIVNATYAFRVVVTKGRRSATACQALTVVENNDHDRIDGTIQCEANCKSKVNPSWDLVLQASCRSSVVDCPSTLNELAFNWTLFRDRRPVDVDWEAATTTGRAERTLAVRGGVFQSDAVYTAHVAVTIVGGRAAGEAEYAFATTSAPRGGSCVVSPSTGVEFRTTFNVSCFDWRDDDLPLQYSFYYSTSIGDIDSASGNVFLESTGRDSLRSSGLTLCSDGRESFAALDYLPAGRPENENRVAIVVQVTNSVKASTVFVTNVQIYREDMDDDALLDAMNSLVISPFSSLSGMMYRGEISSGLQLMGLVSRAMNIQAEDEQRNETLNSLYTEIRKSLREEMFVTIATVVPTSLNDLVQLSSVLELTSRVQNEIRPASQKIVATAAGRFAQLLEAHARQRDSSDSNAVKFVAQDLFACLARSLSISVEQAVRPSRSLLTYIEGEVNDALGNESESGSGLAFLGSQFQLMGDEFDAIEDRTVAIDSFDAARNLSRAVLSTGAPGERPTVFQGANLKMIVKRSPRDSVRSLVIGDADTLFILPSDNDDLLRRADESQSRTYVDVVMFTSTTNPYTWDPSADKVGSSTGSMSLYDESNNEVDVSDLTDGIHVFINRNDIESSSSTSTVFSVSSSQVAFHNVTVTDGDAPLQIVIQPVENLTSSFDVFISYNYSTPNATVNDFAFSLPLVDWTHVNSSLLAAERQLDVRGAAAGYSTTLDPYSIFISSLVDGAGSYYVAVVPSSEDDNATFNYTFVARSPACLFWESENETWSSSGCQAGPYTNSRQLHCVCTHLTFFGGDLFSAPNSFDFIGDAAAAFSNIADNPVAFSLVLSIIGLYFICLFGYAIRADRRHARRSRVLNLVDNRFHGDYVYEIAVATGVRRNAGTRSRVGIALVGTKRTTEARLLDGVAPAPFERGAVDVFRLTTRDPIGDLRGVRVWHDASGAPPHRDWFLDRVRVRDVDADRSWICVCSRWLDVERGDGVADIFVPVTSDEELRSFSQLFAYKSRHGLLDSHLWFSVVTRPATSHFTCVQRLSCCLCLLLCYTCANALWYDSVDEAATATASQSVGPFQFTWAEMYTGAMTGIMVFPINIIIVQIFRLSKPSSSSSSKKRTKAKSEPKKMKATWFTRWLPGRRLGSPTPSTWHRFDKSSTSLNSRASTAESTNRDDVDDRSRESRCAGPIRLPRACIYVGWAILVATSGVASYVTIILGYTFGTDKATEWVNAFLISFVQSIFLTQPVQIVGFAIFFALVIRRPSVHCVVDGDTANVVDSRRYENDDDIAKADFLPPLHVTKYDGTGESFRRRSRRRQGTYKALRSVVGYLTFLFILWLIAYTDRTPDGFLATRTVQRMLVEGKEVALDDVTNMTSFWSYVERTLVPGLFGVKWYNGDWLGESGFAADPNMKIVGDPRLVQFRVRKDSCRIDSFVRSFIGSCFDAYSSSDADTKNYSDAWRLPYKDSNNTSWIHQRNVVKTPLYGKRATYSQGDGGYVVDLDRNNVSSARALLRELRRRLWIDRATRAVVVETTFYNANSNLFSIVRLLVEFASSGGALPSIDIHTTRLYRYVNPFQFFIVACEIVFLLYLVYYTVAEIRSFYAEASAHLKELWNWLEIAVLLLGWAAVGLYVGRYVATIQVTGKISSLYDAANSTHSRFLDFSLVAQLDDAYLYCWSFMVFLSCLKTLRLLQFNRRMLLLASTISEAGGDLGVFFFVISVVFVAFAFLNMTLFGQDIERFSSFVNTIQYQFEMILGNFDADELSSSHRILGPIVFGVFAVTATVLILNLLISSINNSIAVVKSENDRLKNKYEVVEYIREMLGLNNDEAPNGKEQKSPNSDLDEIRPLLRGKTSKRQRRRTDKLYELLETKSDQMVAQATLMELSAIRDQVKTLYADYNKSLPLRAAAILDDVRTFRYNRKGSSATPSTKISCGANISKDRSGDDWL